MMFDHPELFTPYGRMKEQESYDREWRRGKMEIIGIAIVDAEALLAMLLKMEEEIESIN